MSRWYLKEGDPSSHIGFLLVAVLWPDVVIGMVVLVLWCAGVGP